MTVWFITPWHAETARLLPEYINAVQGGKVVVIDNATPEETQRALLQAADEHGWHMISNEENRGFSQANNQGWQLVQSLAADTDIVCFINSDVRASGLATALEGNVRNGGLYGPSLGRQLVLGRWIPYLEGWCIAATMKSWQHLYDIGFSARLDWEIWPNHYGPGYWEDNSLCLRAMEEARYALVHLQLPVQHLGGQSGGIANMGEVLERNRALFVEEVRVYLTGYPELKQTPVRQRYLRELQTDSDIRHHLPLLYSHGKGLVVELGTRSGVSTSAFLASVENRGGHVVSVDIADVSNLYRGHPLWTCIQGDSRHPELPKMIQGAHNAMIDTLLIDTEHTYEQVTAELLLWAPYVRPGGAILCHDTETFPGVRAAIDDWIAGEAPLGTSVVYVLPNNGMGVITLGGK